MLKLLYRFCIPKFETRYMMVIQDEEIEERFHIICELCDMMEDEEYYGAIEVRGFTWLGAMLNMKFGSIVPMDYLEGRIDEYDD